jgi:hypothetical protein
MWFFYFLPILIAIGFLLARVARGGSLTPRVKSWQVGVGVLAIVALGFLGAAFAGLLR